MADLAVALGLDGIVATNTTISREGLASAAGQVEAAGAGGLSGPPLRARATEVMRLLRGRVGPDMTLVGVGGITTVRGRRRAAGRRCRPAAGLHRVRLRGSLVAGPDQRRIREHLQDSVDRPASDGESR